MLANNTCGILMMTMMIGCVLGRLHTENTVRRLSAGTQGTVLTLRLLVVNDYSRCQQFGFNESALSTSTDLLIKSVSAVYENAPYSFGKIKLEISKMFNFCVVSAIPFGRSSDLSQYSDRFGSWLESSQKADYNVTFNYAVLVSSGSFTKPFSNIGGLAATSTICSPFVKYAHATIAHAGTYVVAHEVGHGLGFPHWSRTSCPNDVMAGGTTLSSCSVDFVNKRYPVGLFDCLKKNPIGVASPTPQPTPRPIPQPTSNPTTRSPTFSLSPTRKPTKEPTTGPIALVKTTLLGGYEITGFDGKGEPLCREGLRGGTVVYSAGVTNCRTMGGQQESLIACKLMLCKRVSEEKLGYLLGRRSEGCLQGPNWINVVGNESKDCSLISDWKGQSRCAFESCRDGKYYPTFLGGCPAGYFLFGAEIDSDLVSCNSLGGEWNDGWKRCRLDFCKVGGPFVEFPRSCTRHAKVFDSGNWYKSISARSSCEEECRADKRCGCFVNAGPGEVCFLSANQSNCVVGQGEFPGGLCQ